MIPAKQCYTHIGGKLGTLLMEAFIDNGWIKEQSPGSKEYHVTSKGVKGFTELGIDLKQIKQELK